MAVINNNSLTCEEERIKFSYSTSFLSTRMGIQTTVRNT